MPIAQSSGGQFDDAREDAHGRNDILEATLECDGSMNGGGSGRGNARYIDDAELFE